MIQIYFLSVFFSVLAGYALVFEDVKDTPDIRPGFWFREEKFRLGLGVCAMASGVLKLLSSIEGDIPVLGDLIPAAAGFASGFALFYEYVLNQTVSGRGDDEKPRFSLTLFRNKKLIGIAAIAASILHFLFPRVLFL